MDCVKPIINCSCDGCTDFLSKAFGYLISCEGNIASLKRETAELGSRRDDLRRRVQAAEARGLEPMEQVRWWLNEVEDLRVDATSIEDEFKRRVRCVGDYCLNAGPIYQLSKRAEEKKAEADDLKSREFPKVAIKAVPPYIADTSDASTIGNGSSFKQLQQFVQNDRVRIIGIYGMGGVGKTALLERFYTDYNRTDRDLGEAIFIKLSKNFGMKKTQKGISVQLGLPWKEERTLEERADVLRNVLSKRKFMLFLDNLWKRIDLHKLGIPLGEAKSKVILTTRKESVCDQMDAKKIKVECLVWEEAWDLFRKKAGEDLIRSDHRIRRRAEELVKRSGGLPLALKNIAHTMASKHTAMEWRHVVTKLDATPWQVPGMKEVFKCLKHSYDDLHDGRLRACLLYASLHPENIAIYTQWIIDYCIGEGTIDDFNNPEEAYNLGHELLGILKASSLLECGDDEDEVKMHPMIRSMVSWVECECGRRENKWLVRAGVGLIEAPDVERWRGAERISLTDNEIDALPENPHCPFLLTLFLVGNPALKKIPGGFFQLMPKLKVLDLSHTSIKEFPTGISVLVNLQYLDLCNTDITALPEDLGGLSNLRFLLLAYTPYLESIPSGVIACLSALRVLIMSFSYRNWEACLPGTNGVSLQELEGLPRLRTLGITLGAAHALQRLSGSRRLASSVNSLCLSNCQGLETLRLPSKDIGRNMDSLETLCIRNSPDLEEVIVGGSIDGHRRESWLLLPNLQELILAELPKAKIIWEGKSLENLRYLYILGCSKIEQLMDYEEEAIEEGQEERRPLTVFPSLVQIQLHGLPKFKSLSSRGRTFTFPSLRILRVEGCPELKKLTFMAEKLTEIRGHKKWWDGLEWQESNIQSAFLPLFKQLQ